MRIQRSSARRGGALLLLPLSLAACTSAGGAGTAGAAGGKAVAAKAGPTHADPDAGLLTGAELKGLLLKKSALPKGYTSQARATVDSADLFSAPSAPAKKSPSCGTLQQTAWIRAAGIGSASFAQGDFMDSYQQEFSQEIDSFRGTDAQKVMTNLKQVFDTCAHFTDKSGSSPISVKVARSTVPHVGDQTIKAVITSPSWKGGQTLVATRVENNVITTFYNVQSDDLGAADLDFTKQIAAKVKAAAN